MKLLLITLVSLTLVGCPEKFNEVDSIIYVKNESVRSVYAHLKGKSIKLYGWKPRGDALIKKNSKIKFGANFIEGHSDGSKIHIWLFDKDVVENNDWDYIVKNNLYLVRYDLTLDDLRAMNWTIVYTGK